MNDFNTIIEELKKSGDIYNINTCIDLCKILYKKKLFYEIKEIYEDFLNKGIVDSICSFEYNDRFVNKNINKLMSIFYLCSFKWNNKLTI